MIDQHHRLGARDHQLVVGEPVGGDVVGDARAADATDADEALEQVVEAGRSEVLDVEARITNSAPSIRSDPRCRWYSVRAWSKYGR